MVDQQVLYLLPLSLEVVAAVELLNLVVAQEVVVLAVEVLEVILVLRLVQERLTQEAEAVALDKVLAVAEQEVIENLFLILQLEVSLYQCKRILSL